MPLTSRLSKQLPLTVTHYMEQCVSHYYATQQPFGKGGDFITAPEISSAFGDILSAWLMNQWKVQGSPIPFTLLELGPGRGTLMADMIRAARVLPAFFENVQIILLESSPALRQVQSQTLGPVTWIENLDQLPPQPTFFVANEFFDALPIRQEVHVEGQWVERHITQDPQGNFIFTPEGPIREFCPMADIFAQQLATHLHAHGGAGLIIDYGYTQGETGDTLQAMKNHAYHPILKTPGAADLTAHVDFKRLKEPFKNATLWTQGDFLLTHGLEMRAGQETIKKLTAPEHMGTLFKALVVTRI